MVEPMTGNVWGPPAPKRARLPRWVWVVLVVGILIFTLPLLLGGAAFISAFVASADPPVTRDDARGYVSRAVNAALQRDFDRLCRLERRPENCVAALASGAEHTAPTAVPSSVDLREERDGKTWLFAVRGRDGRNRPYESEVLVRDASGGPQVVNAVFWTGARVDPAELS